MMLFDSHAHFGEDSSEANAWLGRADEAGVEGILAVGGSVEGNRAALATASRFPGRVWAAVGFDRDCAPQHASDAKTMDRLIAALDKTVRTEKDGCASCVAMGEIGLDFHYHPETADAQATLFRLQLEQARAFGWPVIVHSRNAEKETLAALARHADAWHGDAERIGVVHCFTGSLSMAEALTDMGYSLGFSGIATFPNAGALREIVPVVPEPRLLIETDSPFLAPVPMRGRRNEPAFVKHVAEAIATLRGQTTEAVAALSSRNARRIFGIPSPKNSSPYLDPIRKGVRTG